MFDFDEIRLIEYHERLRRNERVLLSDSDGHRMAIAATLLRYGTRDGARSLQLDAGEIADARAGIARPVIDDHDLALVASDVEVLARPQFRPGENQLGVDQIQPATLVVKKS